MGKKNKKQKEKETIDPRVNELDQLYQNGNFAMLQQIGPDILAQENLSEKDKKKISDLLSTIKIEPTVFYVGIGSLVFIFSYLN